MMTPNRYLSSENSGFVPEDKDQRIVQTPYGKGIVIRTRNKNVGVRTQNAMYEIELVNSTKLKRERPEEVSSSNSTNPPMLYTPVRYPSVPPEVGSDVLTKWGRGKLIQIRDDGTKVHVVKLSSWRLANRSRVLCYVSAAECEVIRPKKIYDMDVFEKVEYANLIKQQATEKFKQKDYSGALGLFARAIDAVRYVQHGVGSTNELRADLIIVMITCSNNAALCSSKQNDWDRTAKFAENALVLIEALEEKGNKSKIKGVLNKDGIGDSQLFGTWKVKSLLLIAKSKMEQHDTAKMTNALKKALKAISTYKEENDSMCKQLATQEKDIRRLRLEFSKKSKVAKAKEKKRAQAMFSGAEKEGKKDSQTNETFIAQDPAHLPLPVSPKGVSVPQITTKKSIAKEVDKAKTSKAEEESLKSKAENTVNLGNFEFEKGDDENDDNDDDYSFLEEHSEALLILSGVAIGWFILKMVQRRNNA